MFRARVGVIHDLADHVERGILAPEPERPHERDERADLALGDVLVSVLGPLASYERALSSAAVSSTLSAGT